jgi:mannose-6-phosphate isomerase-like protein (cupin superfamily)
MRAALGYGQGMTRNPDSSGGFAIVNPDEVEDHYEGSDVPGEFRRLTAALDCEQLSVTLIRVPPNSDFEQGSGHFHDEVEEVYLVTRGTLTMRFGDEIRTVQAPAAVRVAPSTSRSHRNECPEPVEMWAISRKIEHADATKIDDFWEASTDAKQSRE